MPGNEITHPDPAEAFEMATNHATLLRALVFDTRLKYASPPVGNVVQPDVKRTPAALLFVIDFVQRTYVEYVIPFLPTDATRKCRAICNPWAWNSSDKWELEWDEKAKALKDADGNVQEFPKLPENEALEKLGDIIGRGFLTKKVILENETDTKARLLAGGESFDFGEEAREAVRKAYPSA